MAGFVKKGLALLTASVLAFCLGACSNSKESAGADGKKVLTVSVEETYKNILKALKESLKKRITSQSTLQKSKCSISWRRFL